MFIEKGFIILLLFKVKNLIEKRHCLSNVFTAVMNYSDAAYAKSEINSSVFLSYNFPSLE